MINTDEVFDTHRWNFSGTTAVRAPRADMRLLGFLQRELGDGTDLMRTSRAGREMMLKQAAIVDQ